MIQFIKHLLKPYIAQDKDYTCSPVAVANIRAALDPSLSRQDTDSISTCLKYILNTTPEGTDGDKTANYISSRFDSYNIRYAPEVEDIDVALEDKEIVMVAHLDDEDEWHDSLIVAKAFGLYLGINTRAGQRFNLLTRKQLDDMLTRKDKEGEPELWLINSQAD